MDFDLLEHYNIPVLAHANAKTPAEAVRAASRMGFPVALKLVSSKILHKTDAGALSLDLRSAEQVEKEFARLMKIDASGSVLVQAFRPGRAELIIGGRLDPQFGPVVLLGLGGVYTEVLRDASLRICPVSGWDAREMLRSLKCYPILAGARGSKPIDEGALIKIITSVSKMMVREKISELDINPLLVRNDGLWAADSRVIR